VDAEHPEKEQVSPAKLEANRLNSLKSTGPRTPEGKLNSSRNALKHGMFCKDVIVRFGGGKESAQEFDQLLVELWEDLQPRGRTEEVLVETLAVCDWRCRRALRAEAGEIVNAYAGSQVFSPDETNSDRSLPGPEATSKILRYQSALHRQKMQILQSLEKLQHEESREPVCRLLK
jgi:hypothetical protein